MDCCFNRLRYCYHIRSASPEAGKEYISHLKYGSKSKFDAVVLAGTCRFFRMDLSQLKRVVWRKGVLGDNVDGRL
jgi:hypothetical protein